MPGHGSKYFVTAAFLFLVAKMNWQVARMAFLEEFIPDAAYQSDLSKEFENPI